MATSEIWVRERVPQRQIAGWIKKKVVKIPRKTAQKFLNSLSNVLEDLFNKDLSKGQFKK